MAENSKIGWTDNTFNPWIGCSKVSALCKFCYAEQFANRYNHAKWGESGTRVKTAASNWKKPYTWDRKAAKLNIRTKVFCSSLADVFDKHPSIKQEWRDELFKIIKETPNLDWLLLTKRPENMVDLLPADWGKGYPNVWIGASIGEKKNSEQLIKSLTAVPAKVRFISAEPLLEPFDLPKYGIDWILIGGESGPTTQIRKLDLNTVRLMIDRAQINGTKVFFKQLGAVLAKQYKLSFDKAGEDFDKYPELLSWLKIREYPEQFVPLKKSKNIIVKPELLFNED